MYIIMTRVGVQNQIFVAINKSMPNIYINPVQPDCHARKKKEGKKEKGDREKEKGEIVRREETVQHLHLYIQHTNTHAH
jgi:hypothetical protein